MSEKRKKINTLDSFFIKKQKGSENQLNSLLSPLPSMQTSIRDSEEPSTSQSSPSPKDEHTYSIFDIALLIKQKVDNIRNISSVWKPPVNFKFPSSGKRNLKFQYNWFQRWNWLVYSQKEDGAYCKFCVFYAERGGVGNQDLGKLVKKPFNNWKYATEVFNKHQKNAYHKFSVMKASNQELIKNEKQQPIDVQVDTALKNKIAENRKKLMPIIDAIILCGRQGISLRGHDDSGPINSPEHPVTNEGNFRAILRTKLKSGDEMLHKHLQNMSANATYLSPTIQNEIVSICGKIITKKIIAKLQEAKFFSILADESSDISGIEQFSLCIRFFNKELLQIEEHFLGFIPVGDLTGQGLANTLLQALEKFGIDCLFLVGQGYDGASAMSGHARGVQAYVREKYPCALFVHCSSHSLNLAISDACDVPHIRNCLTTINKIAVFFQTPKRLDVFKSNIDQTVSTTRKEKLRKLCNTRWVERHDAVITFLELQEVTMAALLEVQQWRDKDSSSDAFSLSKVIQTPEFQFSLRIISKIFSISLPLSKQLQATNLDLGQALQLANDVYTRLLSIRDKVEDEFNSVFKEVEAFCREMNIEIKIPRINSRQAHRTNIPAETPEEYFRRAFFIPFIDAGITHINERLLKHRDVIRGFEVLLPNKKYLEDDLKYLYTVYESQLEAYSFDILEGEVRLWRQLLEDLEEPPLDGMNCLTFLLKNNRSPYFPNVTALLQIYVTIPVTTASNERTFSTLRRLKTYLRNTISEDRLNGLSLMNIHREIQLSSEEVLDEMGKSKRKLLLL